MAGDTKVWRCGSYELRFDRPRIMGVLGITEDSFLDDDDCFDSDAAIAYGMQLLDDGADIIDIDCEPSGSPVSSISADEEAKRVLPVARSLARSGALVCITTRHVDVAKAAVRVGASIVNDLAGFSDARMIEFLKQSTCGVIVAHVGETTEPPETTRTEVQLDTSAAAYAAERARLAAEAQKNSDAKGKRSSRSKRSGLSQPQLPFSEAPNGSGAAADVAAAAETARSDQRGASAEKDAGADDTVSRELSGTQIELSAAAMVAADETESTGNGRATSAARTTHHDTAYVSTSQLRRFTLPDSAPIMRRVMGYLSDQARMLIRSGIDRERICLDPGTGFGGDIDENIVIQRETGKIASLGYPLLSSISSEHLNNPLPGYNTIKESDTVTFGVCLGVIEQGANIVRVRDVAGFAQFMNGFWAIEHPQPRRAFISLTSNMGRRLDNLRAARDLVAQIPMTCVSNCSHIYENEPVDEMGGEPFASAVIEIKTELAPLILLEELVEVEDILGRDRSAAVRSGGACLIDCDLVWMDDEVHGGTKLQLPHPGLGERDFVLVALEDLMHNPVRFFRFEGVDVKEPEERVGHVTGELGTF